MGKGGAYDAILRGEYPRRGAEGERDAERDFERARSAYAGEFAGSEDPLAKAAGKVMGAMGDFFGRASGPSDRRSGPDSGAPRSIEDVIDDIFGPKH
jgi:hypothetical protein